MQSAIPMTTICECYIRHKALRHIRKGRVTIFASGTGNPYFTTDTAAVLRSVEMNCDVIVKGTQVDGIYSHDPKHNADAQKFNKLSYKDVLNKDLKVMDMSAVALARDNKMPIMVFNIGIAGEFARILQGKGSYTIIE